MGGLEGPPISPPALRRSSCYFFPPRSARASLALASEWACLPPSCRLWASSSLATAPFTLGSFLSIFAAASRPSLMTFGQELARATPLVSARLTATAVTVRSFFMRTHLLGTLRDSSSQPRMACGGCPAARAPGRPPRRRGTGRRNPLAPRRGGAAHPAQPPTA